MMQQRLYFLEACDPRLPVALWANQGIDLVDLLDQPKFFSFLMFVMTMPETGDHGSL